MGALTLQRAYYHCPDCRHGFFPRDQALGMARTDLSPGVTRMTGTAAALVSFAQASSLLDELAGVQVGSKHVQRSAEALGREIAALERQSPDGSAAPPAPTLYLGVDGTGVPVRASETAGRAGKQPDGSARTREVKLVVVWTAESRDDEGRPVRDPGSVSYTAAIESAASRDTDPDPSQFAQRMRREAERRGFPLARRRVICGTRRRPTIRAHSASPASAPTIISPRYSPSRRLSGTARKPLARHTAASARKPAARARPARPVRSSLATPKRSSGAVSTGILASFASAARSSLRK